jgi:uncharacterized membrane protein YdjX (TVP38/TMEM64 family)
MLGWLEDIWNAIKDVPYLILAGLVEVLNAIIAAIAALATLVLSLLPGFPEPPSAPSGVVGGLLWFLPLGTILAFFSLMVSCWLGFLAVKIALKWVRAL